MPSDVKLLAGDILLIWNYPHIIASLLIRLFSGVNCDHCATVLDDNDKLMVYEAYPPASQKVTVADYREIMHEWSGEKMRWRRRRDQYLFCEVWRPPIITPKQLKDMHAEGERWLGVKYSMGINYLFETETIHCSEECGRILQAGGFVTWDKEPSKITPIDVRNTVENIGWSHVGDIRYER